MCETTSAGLETLPMKIQRDKTLEVKKKCRVNGQRFQHQINKIHT